MNLESAEQIANAIMYEGYLLYPYRPSSIKNQQRWNFGVVYPRVYSQQRGGVEPSTMHTECLVAGPPQAHIEVTVRFLHLLERTVKVADKSIRASLEQGAAAVDRPLTGQEPGFREEGMERRLTSANLRLDDLSSRPVQMAIEFPGWQSIEDLPGQTGLEILREQRPVSGAVLISAERLEAGAANLYKLIIHIENSTSKAAGLSERRDAVLLQSFISTHTILQAHGADFISLLETPPAFEARVKACQNQNTWPVLLGQAGDFDAMLSSPIILYDYPQIAPESAGSLFDGTEIDEILTLRIMTLTEAEKEELRQGDQIGRELLERTEALTQEQLMKLHGVIRNLGPVL